MNCSESCVWLGMPRSLLEGSSPAGSCGALIFAKLVAEAVYTAHAGPDGRCAGERCFRAAHLAVAAAQVCALGLSLVLTRRCRAVYRAIASARFDE